MQRNLGTVERGIRLLLALALLVVLVQRGAWGWLEGAISVAALFLVLNAVSGRCYLWRWLGIGSLQPNEDSCPLRTGQKDSGLD